MMRSSRKPPKSNRRALCVYAYDPSRGARLDNQLVINIPYEDLQKGPVGKKVAVVDYDATNCCYYEGIDLDFPGAFTQYGLAPSELDPQFHQQMVYAVAMDTIQRFEVALGRDIRWNRGVHSRDSDSFAGKLKLLPHAMEAANAFYDPTQRAILFGYFAGDGDLSGQPVFTCLSQDIVIHETSHAILDSLREHFDEPTGPDALAFHEGFSDIVALLQHFSFRESLLDTIQRTGGLIHRRQLAPDVVTAPSEQTIRAEADQSNPMIDLARQFGEAMGRRQALRSALGSVPDPLVLERTVEPHDRGAILVAAIFDAFFSVYIHRTRDLIRIAYPQGQSAVPNFLHIDLANRLADEAAKTASTIQNMCIRALDYCPPVDITFGDYLRALVTADREAKVEDRMGFRSAMINSFRASVVRQSE
jgi:hypothetical protein